LCVPLTILKYDPLLQPFTYEQKKWSSFSDIHCTSVACNSTTDTRQVITLFNK
jgi:hypothetical protein